METPLCKTFGGQTSFPCESDFRQFLSLSMYLSTQHFWGSHKTSLGCRVHLRMRRRYYKLGIYNWVISSAFATQLLSLPDCLVRKRDRGTLYHCRCPVYVLESSSECSLGVYYFHLLCTTVNANIKARVQFRSLLPCQCLRLNTEQNGNVREGKISCTATKLMANSYLILNRWMSGVKS